jgi:hypothetical protein
MSCVVVTLILLVVYVHKNLFWIFLISHRSAIQPQTKPLNGTCHHTAVKACCVIMQSVEVWQAYWKRAKCQSKQCDSVFTSEGCCTNGNLSPVGGDAWSTCSVMESGVAIM